MLIYISCNNFTPGRQAAHSLSCRVRGETNSPCMHEDVCHIAPSLCAELRVVNQRVLQVPGMRHLQHKLIQEDPVVQEQGNLDEAERTGQLLGTRRPQMVFLTGTGDMTGDCYPT